MSNTADCSKCGWPQKDCNCHSTKTGRKNLREAESMRRKLAKKATRRNNKKK